MLEGSKHVFNILIFREYCRFMPICQIGDHSKQDVISLDKAFNWTKVKFKSAQSFSEEISKQFLGNDVQTVPIHSQEFIWECYLFPISLCN